MRRRSYLFLAGTAFLAGCTAQSDTPVTEPPSTNAPTSTKTPPKTTTEALTIRSTETATEALTDTPTETATEPTVSAAETKAKKQIDNLQSIFGDAISAYTSQGGGGDLTDVTAAVHTFQASRVIKHTNDVEDGVKSVDPQTSRQTVVTHSLSTAAVNLKRMAYTQAPLGRTHYYLGQAIHNAQNQLPDQVTDSLNQAKDKQSDTEEAAFNIPTNLTSSDFTGLDAVHGQQMMAKIKQIRGGISSIKAVRSSLETFLEFVSDLNEAHSQYSNDNFHIAEKEADIAANDLSDLQDDIEDLSISESFANMTSMLKEAVADYEEMARNLSFRAAAAQDSTT